MGLSIKSTFDALIGSVKFPLNFTESPCSSVVTFPSFGSEGHGVQLPQGDSVFCYISVVLQFFFFVESSFFLHILESSEIFFFLMPHFP